MVGSEQRQACAKARVWRHTGTGPEESRRSDEDVASTGLRAAGASPVMAVRGLGRDSSALGRAPLPPLAAIAPHPTSNQNHFIHPTQKNYLTTQQITVTYV
jgi:hypothetical protein